MNVKKEFKILILMLIVFGAAFYLPVGTHRFDNAVFESLFLLKEYAQQHVVFCLITAFFIAGAIGVFVSQNAVLKYLGAKANKVVAYAVASVSGSILAVCSCTILPLFSGIYKMGAGLGPATAFLYSGPAINILAIVLTGRVLGLKMGIARAVGAILFSIIIGLLMAFIFRNEEKEETPEMVMGEDEGGLLSNVWLVASLIGVLVFANWAKPEQTSGIWYAIYSTKWQMTMIFGVLLSIVLRIVMKISWWKFGALYLVPLMIWMIVPQSMAVFIAAIVVFSYVLLTGTDKSKEWAESSWGFAKQILPLLFMGVIVAGFLLGRPGGEGIIPSAWVYKAVGGNSLGANFFASIAGAFMYFATLTEVPILQGLIGNGMGQGPALALLLAGPALSLPNMLVIRGVIGTKKTLVYISLVVVMATISGMIFGYFA